MAKVDNFDIIRKILKFENPGDCYYLQLLRRQSDDPMIDGNPDPNYHGNMHSRSLKDYLIPSIEYLDRKASEIRKLCDVYNVRAYIRLNKRTYNSISMAMLKHIVEQLTSGQSFNSPYSLVASAAGNANAAGKDKTWILDLDAEYLPFKNEIYKMIIECQPYDTIYKEWTAGWVPLDGQILPDTQSKMFDQFCEANFTEIPTKHGIHIIARPFNTKELSDRWYKFTSDNLITSPIPQSAQYEDVKTVFSLTDKYLNHAEAFKECLRKAKKNPTGSILIEKSDNNKTLVKIECPFDPMVLDREWHCYCTSERFFMKCFDCHKDNPSILYVP